MHVCMYVCMYVCTYVYIIYIYIYIYVYMSTCPYKRASCGMYCFVEVVPRDSATRPGRLSMRFKHVRWDRTFL